MLPPLPRQGHPPTHPPPRPLPAPHLQPLCHRVRLDARHARVLAHHAPVVLQRPGHNDVGRVDLPFPLPEHARQAAARASAAGSGAPPPGLGRGRFASSTHFMCAFLRGAPSCPGTAMRLPSAWSLGPGGGREAGGLELTCRLGWSGGASRRRTCWRRPGRAWPPCSGATRCRKRHAVPAAGAAGAAEGAGQALEVAGVGLRQGWCHPWCWGKKGHRIGMGIW